MHIIFSLKPFYSCLNQSIITVMFTVLITTIVATTPYCHLEVSALDRINKDLAPFRNGISATMLKTAKSIDDTCLVAFVDNQLVANDCLPPSKKCVFQAVAAHLPNMEFVVNLRD